jgi:SAM-dependent methyltransferase
MPPTTLAKRGVSDDGGVSDMDATRRFYDTVAAAYAAALPDTRAEAPLDLGMIAQFVADLPDGDGLIVDAGCGTGRLLAHLATLGASPLAGVDLSPAMVTRAREAQPDIRVEVAELTALPFPDATVRGILCWYAIIHSDADEVTAISREARRVLRPGGTLLMGFQAGTGTRRIEHPYGHDVTMDAVLHDPATIARALDAAGFDVTAVAERAARAREKHAQGFVLARRR